jgi:hypothetical protein
MNMLESKDAKIAELTSTGKGKKFFMPIEGKRQEALEREGQFSLFYGGTLEDKHISQTLEAEAIGKSGATVHLYSKVAEQRNMPAALIPMSLIGNEIMQSLAAEMGGTFLQHEGAHESKRKFLSEGLSIFSIIADDECGKSDELSELKSMAKLIESRIEEVGK